MQKPEIKIAMKKAKLDESQVQLIRTTVDKTQMSIGDLKKKIKEAETNIEKWEGVRTYWQEILDDAKSKM